MRKISKSRKKSGCCKENSAGCRDFPEDVLGESTRPNRRRNCSLPTNIKDLLELAAKCNKNICIDIVAGSCPDQCSIEDCRVLTVLDDIVICKVCDSIRCINIDCICQIILDCDDIMDGLFGGPC